MADTGQSSGNGRKDASQLTGIGAAGGLFSGLFGVGGGTVMVPMLVFLRGFGEKRATGTSLMAIVVIAVFGVIANQIFGSVDYEKGVLIGVPALAGVVAGTTLQQRLSDRVLSGMFAGLMIAIVIVYLVSGL
jgi:uncharacterized membrane protein YfcA